MPSSPPPFPKSKIETALIDEVGILAARNDVLRVMHAEMREQRDKHERFIHDQYEQLHRWLGRMEEKIDHLAKAIDARTIALLRKAGGGHGKRRHARRNKKVDSRRNKPKA